MLVGIFAAALAGTPHCVGMCGPLATAASTGNGWVPYHLGRVVTYTTLGGIAGWVGSAVPVSATWMTAVSAVLLVLFSAALAGLLPEPKVAIPGLAKLGARWMGREDAPARFGFGVVNGLLPCGLLYATLALPIASQSALQGAGLMATFALLTAIPLGVAAVSLRGVLKGKWSRVALASVVLVSGLYSVAQRVPTDDVEEPSCH